MKRKMIAWLCVFSLTIGCGNGVSAEAAGKPVTLSKKSLTLQEGQSRTIKVQAVKGKIKSKKFSTSNKKVEVVS